MAPNCAAIHYNIQAPNCGDCPSSTQHNRVVCHDMEVGQDLTCSFSVQNFRTCDDVTGNKSIPVNVTLKGTACTNSQGHIFIILFCSIQCHLLLVLWLFLTTLTQLGNLWVSQHGLTN